MQQRTQRRRVYRTAVVAALIGGACGGSNGEVARDTTATSAATTTASSIDIPATAAETTSSAGATTTDPSATTTDVPTSETTTTSTATNTTTAATTTVAPPPIVDDVDESRLALAAANLYSLPGTGAPCSLQDDRMLMEYLFPAEGGDLYMLCIVGDGDSTSTIDPFDVTLVRPDGSTAIDAMVTTFDDGLSLIVAPKGQIPLVLGVYGPWGPNPRTKALIPIYLPHDRPAGTWTVASGGHSADLGIDRPCAGQSPERRTNPLDVPPDLLFSRGDPFDFEHCRAFPDVTAFKVAESLAIISDWADVLGVTADVTIENVMSDGDPIVGECAPESFISSSQPRRAEVYRWFVALPVHPVDLTIDEDDCIPVETSGNDDDDPATTDGSSGPDVDDADDTTTTSVGVGEG